MVFQLFHVLFDSESNFWVALLRSVMISFGYGLSAVVCAHGARRLKPSLTFRQVDIISFIGCVLLGSLNAVFWLKSTRPASFASDLQPTIFLGIIFSVACLIFFDIYEKKIRAQGDLEKARLQQSEQEKALVLSQLKQLQSQIEPHFLFNTLANLSVLIDKDPAMAKQLLEKLTDLLRVTLKKSRRDWVSLPDELFLIETYLSIQQIRLGSRLTYTITHPPDEETLLLPPMLIQPLVENAIQHGIAPQSRRGHLDVKIERDNAFVRIRVIDNGVGLQPSGKTSGNLLGLENLKQRLKTLYGDHAQLSLRENKQAGVTAEICLPLVVVPGQKESHLA
jgi:sensor histidine kinase YesM